MLDSRKLLLALVVVALCAIPASAQFNPPLSCFAQAAGTPSIRAEGVTELVGDVIIRCTGGDPTPENQNLRQVNIQIFSLPQQVNITSRLQGSGANTFSEALLFVDEPDPANQTICGSPTVYPYSVPVVDAAGTSSGQPVIIGVCGAHTGAPGGNGVGTYDPDTAITVPNTYRGNTYQARQAPVGNSLIWQGIPFDPPGTLTDRVIRLTNVRINASQLGVTAGNAQNFALNISTSASGVINPIALPITNPTPVVAVAQNSLDFSVQGFRNCLQCVNANSSFFNNPTTNLGSLQGSSSGDCSGQFLRLRYRELFPSVFRRRNQVLPIGDPLTSDIPGVPVSQDILGFPFQTESGFMKAASSGARWPAQAQNGNIIAGTSGPVVGLADHGTRLIARFNNIQSGIQIWVQGAAPVNSIQAVTDTRTGTARLINTSVNGDGPFSAVNLGGSGGSLGQAQVSIIGNTGQAVWEIVNADTTTLEDVNVGVIFSWVARTSDNLPSLGTSTVNGALAPLSTTASASTTASIPRFVDAGVNRNLVTINSCRSNLLFPFVSNQSGFDTGLAIANTSKDPFGTQLQTGACTINFYGYISNAKVCLSHTSPSITGGEHFVWSLANGGQVTATAGFQGYVIAQCNFQYAHGYAFISDLGAQRLAQGYLALVMDAAIGTRTGSLSETLGH